MEQGVEIRRDAAASGGIFRRAAMDSGRAFLLAIGILLAPWQKGAGDELRFATAAQWRQWELPLGAVELTREGIIRPVAVRRNNNAALDAVAFGGGISRVGSNALEAPGVLDGDGDTGWGPDLDERVEDWFVEVDLGRVVSAHRVHLVFSERGPPFEIFDLLLSTGEQFRDETRTQIEGTLAYRIKERFTEDRRRRITYELNPDEPFPVHFVRVEILKAAPEARLVEIEVEAFGDNLVQGAIERGGSVDIVVGVDTKNPDTPNLANALQLMDGRISTVWSNIRATRADTDVIAQITLDLGAVYWVDQVRLISFSLQYRGFSFNFYEVLTSDGSRAPDGSLRWTKHFSGWGSRLNRVQGLADHRFTSLPVRFVRIRWKTWDANCGDELGGEDARGCGASGTTSELQVFGRGVPVQVDLRSPILDLQGQKNINALRWGGQAPGGTRLELRSRSGNTLDTEVIYRDPEGKEITQRQWERRIPSFRGPIDTVFVPGADWSPWSPVYLEPDQPFQSPSMRRYVQLEGRLVSGDSAVGAWLDWVVLDFSEPLAQQVVAAELAPVLVQPGRQEIFTYYVRPVRTRNGFDRLLVRASTDLQFDQVRVDGVVREVAVAAVEDGFAVQLPQPVRSGQLVEVDFAAAIFLDATRFELFLEDSRLAEPVRQRVEPGDAAELVESSTNVVRLPLGRSLWANMSIAPSVLTPNGDGVNDELVVALDLVDVLTARPVQLEIFDLAGRRVAGVESMGMAGPLRLAWDGRTGTGRQVPPGNYIARLKVKGDGSTELAVELVSIVY